MKVIITENQFDDLLNKLFDKEFNKFTLYHDGEGYYRWFKDGNDEPSFSKNYWGAFFTHNCDDWKSILNYRSLGLNESTLFDFLIDYLNNKYFEEIKVGNKVRKINNDWCNRM
jgi:hypothetical protein